MTIKFKWAILVFKDRNDLFYVHIDKENEMYNYILSNSYNIELLETQNKKFSLEIAESLVHEQFLNHNL